MSTAPLPVFLISFNRGAALLRTIAGLRRQAHAVDITIHDNGSTDPATTAVLADLERDGIAVVRRGPIATQDELENVNGTIAAYADAHEPFPSYAISDADIDLSIADPNSLDLYQELLETHPTAECAGPMLRIRDIPAAYPLHARALNRHIEQFWHKSPCWFETSHGRIAAIEADFDTTLAVHRAGVPFRRLRRGLRVYEPHEALHLDWYPPWSEDAAYAATSNPAIAHWNNTVEAARHRGAVLEHDRYIVVRRQAGVLREAEIRLPREGRR
jgi:hypothetical protein